MGFWFSKEDTYEDNVVPFTPKITKEQLAQISFSKEFQGEMYDDRRVLSNLLQLLTTMLMCCRDRKSKSIRLTEEDLKFLVEIALKEKQLKNSLF